MDDQETPRPTQNPDDFSQASSAPPEDHTLENALAFLREYREDMEDDDSVLDLIAAREARGKWFGITPPPYFDTFRRSPKFVDSSHHEIPDLSRISSASPDELADLLRTADYHIPTEMLTPHIASFIQRFGTELTSHPGWHNTPEGMQRDVANIAFHTINIINRIALETTEPIDPKIIENLFGYFTSNNTDIAFEAAAMVGSIIDFDSRIETEKPAHIADRTVEEVTKKILTPATDQDINIAVLLTDQFMAERPLLADQILLKSVERATSDEQLRRIAARIMDTIGIQHAEKILKEASLENPTIAEQFTRITNIFTKDQGHERVVDIGELYDKKFDIGSHHPDAERDAYESNLLKQHFTGKGRVLDIAAGTGRTKRMLEAEGFRVIAFDYSRGNVARMKEADPKGAVFVGDWYNLPFASGSIEAVDCMGRSFAHVENDENGKKFFEEVNRILTPGGTFIMDAPDNSKGHFKAALEHYSAQLASQGVEVHNHSEIVDSPNGRDIMRRYVPSLAQLAALAKMEGFSTEIIGKQDYTFNKEENTNYYLKFIKKNTPLPSDRIVELEGFVKTGEAWFGNDDQDILDLIDIQQEPEKKAA